MNAVELRQEVRLALEGDEWPVQATDDPDVLRTSHDTGFLQADCFAQLHDDGLLSFYVYLPRVDSKVRATMAEFVVRANYGLILANLELDLDDGELRCKASADLAAATPVGALVVSAARAAAQTAEFFLPGMSMVMSDGASALQALAACDEQA